jgi:hypothetical protein
LELLQALQYVTNAHFVCVICLQYSQLLEPLQPTNKASARRLSELLACHERFCEQQLANTKTARVLEVAFDPEFTQAYMSKVRRVCTWQLSVEPAASSCNM